MFCWQQEPQFSHICTYKSFSGLATHKGILINVNYCSRTRDNKQKNKEKRVLLCSYISYQTKAQTHINDVSVCTAPWSRFVSPTVRTHCELGHTVCGLLTGQPHPGPLRRETKHGYRARTKASTSKMQTAKQ